MGTKTDIVPRRTGIQPLFWGGFCRCVRGFVWFNPM